MEMNRIDDLLQSGIFTIAMDGYRLSKVITSYNGEDLFSIIQLWAGNLGGITLF